MTSDENRKADDPVAKPAHAAARPTLMQALREAYSKWWGTGPVDDGGKSSNELAADRTDMATTRTLMAADRTLMAWVRTALSLDSFGFTIYKVLQGFAESGAALPSGETPRYVGLFLTGLGTLAMVMGAVEYVQTLRDLHTLRQIKLRRPAFIMALLMSVMGVLLFFGIITKLF
jgi:putative membrane protein